MGKHHSKHAPELANDWNSNKPASSSNHTLEATLLIPGDQGECEHSLTLTPVGAAGDDLEELPSSEFDFSGASTAREAPPAHGQPLSFLEELAWAVAIGLAGGLFTAAYSTALKAVLIGVWTRLPDALFNSAVWTPDSVVPIQAYIVVAAVALSVLGCLLADALPPHENIVAWIGQVHSRGAAPIRWAGPMVAVSLLTVPSGASIGPEGVMIVVAGNAAGAIGGRLGRGSEVTRWFSLVGASACVSSFFGLPLAGSFFVLSMLHTTGEPQHFEALKGALLASAVCCAVTRAIIPPEIVDDTSWMFPSPGDIPFDQALLAGTVFGAVGSLLSYLTSATDKTLAWIKDRFEVPRVAMMAAMAAVFGAAGMVRPSLLFWSEMQMPYALGSGQPLPLLSPLLQRGAGAARKSATPLDMVLQGVVKAILAGAVKAAKFPGGIIFPMIFAGGCVGMGVMEWLTADLGVSWAAVSLAPVAVMAAAQSAVNRTPWATILLVVDTHAGGPEVSTKVALLAAVITAELLTWGRINMFPTQRPRTQFGGQSCAKNRTPT